jgi:hypothetical protein
VPSGVIAPNLLEHSAVKGHLCHPAVVKRDVRTSTRIVGEKETRMTLLRAVIGEGQIHEITIVAAARDPSADIRLAH